MKNAAPRGRLYALVSAVKEQPKTMQDVEMETNKMVRAWIWFWYNDATRICIMIGVPIMPALIVSYAIFGPGEYLREVAMATYLLFFGWAMADNDYSNLRRIGLDEHRRKLGRKQ